MKPKFVWMIAFLMSITLPGISFAEGGGKKASTEVKTETTDKGEGEKTDEEKKAEHTKKVSEARELAIEWVMAVIAKVAPPGRQTYFKEAQETKEEGTKRHRSIAEDLIEVVFNPKTKPIFRGKRGRAKTATLMMGIMLHESGFGRHIDYNLGKYARGDGGNSWCMMQMNVGKGRAWKHAGGWNIKHDRPWRYKDKKEDIVVGANGPEMIADRRKCFTEGLRLIRISFRSCYRNPFKERLCVYASGRCTAGQSGSRRRINSGIKMFTNVKTRQLMNKFEEAHLVEHVGNMLKKRAEKEAKAKALADKQKAKEKQKQAEDSKPPKKKKEAAKDDATSQGAVADKES